MARNHTKCYFCAEPLPENRGKNRKFCNQAHRNSYYRRVRKKEQEHSAKLSELQTLPEHVQDMIYLAFGADNGDVIREVMREEIRSNITQAVRDNVLGAAEIMTHMLPKVMAGLMKDVESHDWVVRSRAQALVMKYAMAFAEKEPEKTDLGTLQVVLNTPVPATPLGAKVVEEIEAGDANVEDYEKDWPVCPSCEERKHPDAIVYRANGRIICKTCKAYREIKGTIGEPKHGTIGGLY